ncbi:MAG: hypothetical protein AAGA54_08015 [Myxococcota bacterium]
MLGLGRRVWLGAAAVLMACQFETSSADTDTDGTSSTGDDDAGSPTSNSLVTTNGSTSSTTDGTSSGRTTETDSTSRGVTGEPSTTTGAVDETSDSASGCAPFVDFTWAVDIPEEDTNYAPTNAMSLPELDGEPVIFLRSTTPGLGTAAIAFDVPCADDVFYWVLAWDAQGNDPSNADAYVIGLNIEADEIGPDSPRWEYGCDNDYDGPGWQWYRIRETGDDCADGGEIVDALEEGEHRLRLSNREPASTTGPIMFNFTGIAAVVATNDPDYDPHDDYDPSR